MCESLRQAAQCLGLPGDFSVLRDFFGYLEGFPGGVSQLSLRGQMRALGGRHIHLDLIQVAVEQFTETDRRDIDRAVQRTREAFAQVDLGVGRVAHFQITEAEADGLETIDSHSQAKKLTRRFRGPHDDAIDVFFVREYNVDGKDGESRIDLPCNKDRYNFSGAVIGMGGAAGGIFPELLPHELGHGLGLKHVTNTDNLMHDVITDIKLAASQGEEMRSHCFARPGCCKE